MKELTIDDNESCLSVIIGETKWVGDPSQSPNPRGLIS